jgi:hypothetical protein
MVNQVAKVITVVSLVTVKGYKIKEVGKHRSLGILEVEQGV